MQLITILQSALPQIKAVLASICYIFFAIALLTGFTRRSAAFANLPTGWGKP